MKFLKNQAPYDCGRVAIYNYLLLTGKPIDYLWLRPIVKVNRGYGMCFDELIEALKEFGVRAKYHKGKVPDRSLNKAYIVLVELIPGEAYHWVLLYREYSFNLRRYGKVINRHKNLKGSVFKINSYPHKIVGYLDLGRVKLNPTVLDQMKS